MKRSILTKSVAVVPIVWATWFVTNAIMARASWPRDTPPSQGNTPQTSTPEVKARPLRVVSRSKMKTFDVQVDGNIVMVDAMAALTSETRSTSYLWRIRVGQDGVKEIDRAYVEQLFELPDTGTLSPKFIEAFQLPAGLHNVALTLYAMPKGYNIKQLNDSKVDKAMAIIHVHKEIVVQ